MRNRGLFGRHAIVLALQAASLPFLYQQVEAAEAVVSFDIPAGSLAQVLNEISTVGGRPIAFPAALAAGRQAGAIVGRKTVRGAVAQAIAGSGLVLVGGESGPLSLRASAKQASAAGGGGATDIADIDVTGNASQLKDNGFQPGDVGVVGRLDDLPLQQSPISVAAVTSDVIQSQSVTNVSEALQNAAGITVASQNNGVPVYTIRGFNSSTNYYQDGAISPALAGSIPIDDVERIDVLKGPTSILTGTTDEGGLVNVTTKKPTDETIRNVTVRYGSYGYKTLAFDLGGIVPQTEGLTYRFVASGNNATKSYGGYLAPHEDLVAPSLQWKDKATSVLLGLRYTDAKQASPTTAFAPYLVDDPQLVRVPRGVAEGGLYSGGGGKTLTLYSDVSHDFGSLYGLDVTANNHVQYALGSYTFNTLQWSGDDYDNGRYGMIPQYETEKTRGLTERADLTGKFDAGFFQQTSKVGFDSTFQNYSSTLLDYFVPTEVNPSTGTYFVPLATYSHYDYDVRSSVSSNVTGMYYLEKIDTLNNRLHILGSVREDHFFSGSAGYYDSYGTYSAIDSKSSQYGLSWTAGGAFEATNWITLYGNRSNGYSPQVGTTSSGSALSPQSRDQSEVGSRFYFLDKRFTVTTSFYKLLQLNVAEQDPTNALAEIIVGGIASRGFEFEAQGNLAPGLDITTSFTTVHAAYTDPALYSGVIQATPQITASAWATYAFQSGAFSGFMFGFGAHGNTSSVVSSLDSSYDTVSVKVPGYVVEDAMIGFKKDRFSLNLKLNNIFDRYYYYPTIVPIAATVGEGRNFLLTSTYAF